MAGTITTQEQEAIMEEAERCDRLLRSMRIRTAMTSRTTNQGVRWRATATTKA
jgi:hypothetical protein